MEPVGVWVVSGGVAESFYPPETARFCARGENALFDRPRMTSLEDWAQFKVATSPNWKIYKRDPPLFGPDAPLDPEQIFRLVTKTAAQSQPKPGAPAPLTHYESPSFESTGTNWGASRFAIAQSWWIAAELSRRHPGLVVSETHPGGGTYDVLRVASLRAPAASRVLLNRVGTVQVHGGLADDFAVPWTEVAGMNAPQDFVKRLEGQAGWRPPLNQPVADMRTLAYRFIAAVLAAFVNDKHSWDARSVFFDSADWDDGIESPVGFIGLDDALSRTPRLGIPGEPQSHFWTLERDGSHLLVISIEGFVFSRSAAPVDLMARYLSHDYGCFR